MDATGAGILYNTGVFVLRNYVERNLRQNERIIAKAVISHAAIGASIFFSSMLMTGGIIVLTSDIHAEPAGIPMLAVGFIRLIIALVKLGSVELGVTDKKIIGKTGVIIAKSIDTYLENIDNISISESFWGKVFGYSTIQVNTTSSMLRFPYVKDAMAFKNVVLDRAEIREDKKMRRQAWHIASMEQLFRDQLSVK